MELVAVNGVLAGTVYVLAQGLIIPSPDDASPARAAAASGRSTAESSPSRPSTGTRRSSSTACRSRAGRSGPATKSGWAIPCSSRARTNACRRPCSTPARSRSAASRKPSRAGNAFRRRRPLCRRRDGLRAGDNLAKLTRAVGALTSVRGLAAIDSALAGFILGVVPAERVAFVDHDGRALSVRSGWSSAGSRAIEVDDEIVKHACSQRSAAIVETRRPPGAGRSDDRLRACDRRGMGRGGGTGGPRPGAPATAAGDRGARRGRARGVAGGGAAAGEQGAAAGGDQPRTQHGGPQPADAHRLRSHRAGARRPTRPC